VGRSVAGGAVTVTATDPVSGEILKIDVTVNVLK
jgi:hypothetical protein